MIDLYKVKTFSQNPDQGNLAGVVPNALSLSEHDMQAIAKQVGSSESAFIIPSTMGADIRIRWFTPTTEIGICMHATIAALTVLRSRAELFSPTVKIETKNAELLAELRENDIFITVDGYKHLPVMLDMSKILPLLPLHASQVVGTPGIIEIFEDRELMIEVSSFADLKTLKPKLDTYAEICNQLGISGISIFTQETQADENHIHTREFAPLYGYLEDPLCGTAAGAIHTYLKADHILRIEQGYFCDTAGIIIVERGSKAGEVMIGGTSCIIGQEPIEIAQFNLYPS